MSEKLPFPRWMYSPDGQSAIFEREEDVPAGWEWRPFPPKEDAPAKAEDTAERYNGFSRNELEQILRNAGQRIYARESVAKMFTRAELLGLIVNGQVVEVDENE